MPIPEKLVSREHGAFHANPFEPHPIAVSISHGDDAAETHAKSAAHRRFDRHLRGNSVLLREASDFAQHRRGAAGIQGNRRCWSPTELGFQRLCHQAFLTKRTVFGRTNDGSLSKKLGEVPQTGKRHLRPGRCLSVKEAQGNVPAHEFVRQQVECRQTDATGDQQNIACRCAQALIAEATPQGAEKINGIPGPRPSELLRPSASNLIDELALGYGLRSAHTIEDKGATKDRFELIAGTKHGELTWMRSKRYLEGKSEPPVILPHRIIAGHGRARFNHRLDSRKGPIGESYFFGFDSLGDFVSFVPCGFEGANSAAAT